MTYGEILDKFTDSFRLSTIPIKRKVIQVRLIDADAFKEYICNAYEQVKHMYPDGGKWARQITEDFCKDIDEQPTINPQKWIPCSERLPEDEYVLISKKPTKISGSKWNVAIAIRTADPRSGKIQWRDSGFGIIQDDEVLAWQSLPKPYKEDEA